MRSRTLREFYHSAESKEVKFECEHYNKHGSIDLVLTTNHGKYAFEIKRWQTGKEKDEILGKDYPKLECFQRSARGNKAYELTYSVLLCETNDIEELNNRAIDDFLTDFHEKFDLLKCRTLVPPNDAPFRIAIYLAELAKK